MRILYMYAELMGYNIPVLKELVSTYNAEIHLIHWDHKKLTIYQAPEIENVIFYKRSNLRAADILKLAKDIKPDIAYVPNWYDKGYLKTCAYLRKIKIPVVSGLDNQWHGTTKQYLGIILMRLYLKKFYSHMWVAGPFQFEFARRLGFRKDQIIFNLYSADTSKFTDVEPDKKESGTKFLFIGRLEKIKGIEDLLGAWSKFPFKNASSLTLIGDGSLEQLLSNQNDIKHISFLQPKDLALEIKNHNCFILPSRYEPFGVVIHELSCAGFPIIASDVCGASPVFIIPGYNGYLFNAGNENSLLSEMIKMHQKTKKELKTMGQNALERSKIISPQISASSFVSVIKNLT